jgi:peptidoglycan/xylan/chitin deacetylase (PgdA/CDA1 family)
LKQEKGKTTIKYFYWVLALLVIFLILVESTRYKLSQQAVPILVYHLIDSYKGQKDQTLYVSPKSFEQQMTYLKKHGFTPLTFEDWNEIGHVQKPIFITFDDGYKDNIKMWGIFEKVQTTHFHPKATIFVITHDIGHPNHLNKKEIHAMANSSFFSIQSHTVTHSNLRESKDLDYEFGVAKKTIEAITNKPVIAVSYPYSFFDEKVITTAANYYKFGVTTMPGFYMKRGKLDETLLLPRIYIKYSTTLNEFAQLING